MTLNHAEQLSVEACFEPGDVSAFVLPLGDYRDSISAIRMNGIPARMHGRWVMLDGIQVSAPWQPTDNNFKRYHVGGSASGWRPQVAFGAFKNIPIHIGHARLDVVILSRAVAIGSSRNLQKELGWIQDSAAHVLLAYGEFLL